MEGILIAIISGLFSLAGVLLSDYLKKRKSAKGLPLRKSSQKATAAETVTPRPPVPPHVMPHRETPEKTVFVKMPLWWVLATAVITVSIGGAFLAEWVINYGLGVFNTRSPEIEFSWLALVLGGMTWGLAYVLTGTAEADDVMDCLFPLFDSYDDLFAPVDLGDFLRALLSALPINFLISWGAALGLGVLAAAHVGAQLSGVVYLAFGGLVFIGVVWFLSEELL